ncbi:tachylectin-related carbohydrate-binding protein [Cytobacillus oceanisediminis]|uniref:tachylectin-related carbohydrate-binding protein n=1 Tax=Cytobacillus oceanisediminis TaxID=665099 RepID=UPI003735A7E2
MSNNDDNGIKKTDNGIELQTSVIDTVLPLFPLAGPGGAAIAVGIKAVMLTKEILGFLGYLRDDTSIADAIRVLQDRINKIEVELREIHGRLNQITGDLAATENRATLERLLDYHAEVKKKSLALQNTPSQDVVGLVNIANDLGILVDTFLRNNYDIWRWTDIEVHRVVDPITGTVIRKENRLVRMKFKNLPTLPVYLMALLTWLAAREKVVQIGERGRLDDDIGRIARHLAAVSVRPGFDKYRDGEFGIPQSITENIKWRIRAFPRSSTAHPVNRVCKWSFDVQNWMSGERKRGDPFDVYMGSDNVLCTINPDSLGMPNLEIETETEAGVDVLIEMAEALQHVAKRGTLKKPSPLNGTFPTTPTYPPNYLYVITLNGDLQWYRNLESSRPGGSTLWYGPLKVGNGWDRFTSVFSGGGPAIYGVELNGDLMWYGHDGYYDGSPRWRGPRKVGWGWNNFKSIFSGGEFVVYGIQPNGDLIWYRHHAALSGGDFNTWSGQIKVGSGWADFTKVFSGGKGYIYAIREDGVLVRYRHRGYLTGADTWESYSGGVQYRVIGPGWNEFLEVIAGQDGVLYAFTRDGRILWYRYTVPDLPIGFPARPRLEGPVEIKRQFPAFRKVFVLMEPPAQMGGGVH